VSDHLDENTLRVDLRILDTPLVGLKDTAGEWKLGTRSFSKTEPYYRIGWGFGYGKGAHLYKQWFDFEDGKRGWAIVFVSDGANGSIFVGWVPPEREAEADQWITFLNAHIAERLAAAR
jgi:hypothetical protein